MTVQCQTTDWWAQSWPTQPNPGAAGLGPRQKQLLAFLGEHSHESFAVWELATRTGFHKTGAYEGAKALVGRGLVDITTPVGVGAVRRIKISSTGAAYLSAHQPK